MLTKQDLGFEDKAIRRGNPIPLICPNCKARSDTGVIDIRVNMYCASCGVQMQPAEEPKAKG
jgi:hypothetical protein